MQKIAKSLNCASDWQEQMRLDILRTMLLWVCPGPLSGPACGPLNAGSSMVGDLTLVIRAPRVKVHVNC